MYPMNFHEEVYRVLSEITEMLIAKNQKYGNSAIEPLGIFSNLSPEEGLKVRIDDKLKRIKNGSLDKDDEDVINDLIGYLVILKILQKEEKAKYSAKKAKQKELLNKIMTDEGRKWFYDDICLDGI
jgi:tRNA nucleotidyltransferase/poly(A) polymerase